MKNFVIGLLLSSSSAVTVTHRFADGLSESEIISQNPSNVQNNFPTCVGTAGEVEGVNCRSNNSHFGQQFPTCTGAAGENAGVNCTPPP